MITVRDRISAVRILELDKRLQLPAIIAINELEKEGILLRVTETYRSIEDQLTYFNAGKSDVKLGYHQFRLALDVVEMVEGIPDYKSKNWLKIGQAFEKQGFEWGGRWLSKKQKTLNIQEQKRLKEAGEGWDKPHMQMTFGKKISEL
jgi:hypothetical protein